MNYRNIKAKPMCQNIQIQINFFTRENSITLLNNLNHKQVGKVKQKVNERKSSSFQRKIHGIS